LGFDPSAGSGLSPDGLDDVTAMSMHVILCSNSRELVDAAFGAFGHDGFRVTVCESGLEVLGAVEIIDADLLVLDLETPGLNGLLMIQAIRELSPALSIVAVSTKPQVDARAVSHKGVSYVTLPSGSGGGVQASLASLVQIERYGLPSGMGSAR